MQAASSGSLVEPGYSPHHIQDRPIAGLRSAAAGHASLPARFRAGQFRSRKQRSRPSAGCDIIRRTMAETAAPGDRDRQVLRGRPGPQGRVVRPACEAKCTRWSGRTAPARARSIKVVTGAVVPDAGTLDVDGQRVPQMTPALARALGIAAIYQQPSLFPDLSVAENIALALEGGRSWRRVDWPARRPARRGSAGAGRRVDRSRTPRRHAEHARAADGRDRQGARRRRARADHGRADRVAHRSRGGAALRRRSRVCATTAPASSTSRTGSRRSAAIADRITVLRDGRVGGDAAAAQPSPVTSSFG